MIRPYWGNTKRKSSISVDEQMTEQEEQISNNNIPTAVFGTDNPAYTKIEVVENRIYFYAEISDQTALALNKVIADVQNAILYRAQVTYSEPIPIYLYINSYGGSIFSGLSIMDEILGCQVPVVTIVDGVTASAASFFSVVGNKRLMKRHSFILIHQLSSNFWGNYENFNDEKENLDKFMTVIKSIYKTYTKIPMKKLNEILKHDLYLTAEEAKEYGLIDDII